MGVPQIPAGSPADHPAGGRTRSPAGHVDAGPVVAARVHGLGDLAATVPYLLGFVPRESLTCLAVTGRKVGLAARLDLADVVDRRRGEPAVDTVVRAVARTGATDLLALVSSDRPPAPVVLARVLAAAERVGLDVLDVGWQRGDRCRSLLCADPACCPPEGVPVDPYCRAVTAATYAGAVALPDRAAVAAEFDRPAGSDPAALDPTVAAWETRAVRAVVAGHGPRWVDGEVDALLAAARAVDRAGTAGRRPPTLDDDTVARLVVGLSDIAVRDAVWLAVDGRRVRGGGLWLELALRAPSPYDAAPLFLHGWRRWRSGDGVRASLSAERALAGDPGYSAARLLLEALRAGIDPHRMPPLTDDGNTDHGDTDHGDTDHGDTDDVGDVGDDTVVDAGDGDTR